MYRVLLCCVECMSCRLLLPMCAVSVTHAPNDRAQRSRLETRLHSAGFIRCSHQLCRSRTLETRPIPGRFSRWRWLFQVPYRPGPFIQITDKVFFAAFIAMKYFGLGLQEAFFETRTEIRMLVFWCTRVDTTAFQSCDVPRSRCSCRITCKDRYCTAWLFKATFPR